MSECFVIMYTMHQGDYTMDSVATVCKTLGGAEGWLRETCRTQARFGAFLERSGMQMRIITNFGPSDWSSYYIRKHRLED